VDSLVELASAQTLSHCRAREEDADLLRLKALDQRLKGLACGTIIEKGRDDFQSSALQETARRVCEEIDKGFTSGIELGM
jgi:hypothetical protein